ncbi:MAG TPA: C40 family peptidase [Longimicrobiales bacterium]
MLRRYVVLTAARLLLWPAPAIAQTVIDVGAFVETAATAAVPSGFGGALAYGGARVQLRVSGRAGALDLSGEPRFWRADVDLQLKPLNAHPVLRAIAPFDAEPYLFIGAGVRGEDAVAGDGTRWDPSVSWGAGVRLPVLGQWLALYGEGRNRSGDWEVRGGIGLRFTGGPAPAVPAPVPGGPERSSTGPDAKASGREVGASTGGGTRAGADRDGRGAERSDAPDVARRVLAEAERHLGVRYRWGGESPETGFDCSGFVQYVYAKVGIALPRVTREQAKAGIAVPLDAASFRPGDLLFFASDGKEIHHVALYAGDGRIIHSPKRGTHVRYDDLRTPEGRWYREHLVAVRRVLRVTP